MKKAIIRILIVAALAGGGWYGYRWYTNLPSRQVQLAVTKVQRGDVVIRAYTRGEIHAVRATTLVAPNLNGTVQVTQLAPAGAMAKAKDLIVEYDDSELLASLDEDQMALQQTEEQIKGAKANLGITDSQDSLNLLRARYSVRGAELAVQKNPVIDAISAKKNLLQLEQTRRNVTQLEQDIAMRKAQNASVLAVLNEQRNRNTLDLRRDQARLIQTKALSEIEGLVAVRQNRGGMFNFGQVMPDIRTGDTLQPGMPVADVLDLSEVEVWAKVGELDRANLTEGQEVLLRLDSVPDKRFSGKIKSLSGTATADVFSGDPSKKFDVVFSVDMRALLSGLGMKPAEVERIMAAAASNAAKNIVNTANTMTNPVPLTPQGTAGMAGGGGGAQAQGDAAGGGVRQRAAGGFAGGAAGGRAPGAGADAAGARAAGGDQQGGQAGGARGGADAAGGRAAGAGADAAGARAAGGDQQGGQAGSARGGADAAGGRAAGAGADAAGARAAGGDQQGGQAGGARGGADAAGGRGQGTGTDAAAGRGQGGGARGAQGGGTQGGQGAPGAPGGGRGAADMMARMGGSRFTEDERKNAKLPLPPDEDSAVQVLLRPGLLADVEITVEKLPDVIHVPSQAVFDKGGQHLVYVLQKNGRFQPREVQVVKQSESMTVLAGGVKPGETVALADPTADKNAKKEGKKSSSGSGDPMSSMPGGK